MATSKEYKDYIMEQVNVLDNMTYRPMMGEYVVYHMGLVIGGIYDERLLVKKTPSNEPYGLEEIIPYPTAKPMYYVSDLDNKEQLKAILLNTYNDLVKKSNNG